MTDHDTLFDDLEDPTPTPTPTPKRKTRKKPTTPDPKEPDLSFEDALKQLEAVVAEMESGQLPIEECIKRFETGSKLAAYCTKSLNSLEKRVQVLVDEQQNQWRDLTSQDND